MNLLKSKKVDIPRINKNILECDTKGTNSDEAYEDEAKDEEVELVVKKRKNLSPGGLTYKKRKRNEVDYEIETRVDEDSKEEKGKKTKGKIEIFYTKNSLKKDEIV